MAFNFLGGNNYPSYVNPLEPNNNSVYNDPRRGWTVGSFNPNALINFSMGSSSAPTASTPASPAPTINRTNTGVTAPATTPTAPPPPPPTISQPPATQSPFSGNVGNSQPYQQSNNTNGGPLSGPSQNSRGIDYARYPTIREAYANNAPGQPGWNWDEWARATGNQDALLRSTSGDYMNFTWNPNGHGYYNPQTGETFDRFGETIRR